MTPSEREVLQESGVQYAPLPQIPGVNVEFDSKQRKYRLSFDERPPEALKAKLINRGWFWSGAKLGSWTYMAGPAKGRLSRSYNSLHDFFRAIQAGEFGEWPRPKGEQRQ